MKIAGMGVVFARGRGIDALEQALKQGWVPPVERVSPGVGQERTPSYCVDQASMADKAVLKRMRRADRFSRMAALAAWDAAADAGVPDQAGGADLGIILATAFGPQATAFRFLDEIMDHGDGRASPTLFSHSVHNAAASYVASALNSQGPTLTVTQFSFSFHQALLLADAWLEEGRCERVLVGSVEEGGSVLEYIFRRKLRTPEDGRIRPFGFSASPAAVPGEGSVFLMLSRDDAPGGHCRIAGVSFDDGADAGTADLYLLDADGMSGDERDYGRIAGREVVIAGYSPLFGSMMTGSAFHCATAALILTRQTRYACPVQDNPHGARICAETGEVETGTIRCIRYDCQRERAVIELER
jgi:3-oxoacyl-[acyl-carrier-protein] synthase II